MGILSTLFGCGKSESKIKLEEITSRADLSEGFNDVYLKIVEETKIDSKIIYVAKGLYKNEVVGVKFEVKSDMPIGIKSDGDLDAENGFINNPLKIVSIGIESDNFIKALSELYGFPSSKKFTTHEIFISAYSLNQIKPNFEKKGNYKFKLFFEEENEDLYCELFFNINTNTKFIEFLEKDEAYRKPLIEVLTK